MPADVAARVQELDKLFFDSSSSRYRVELMALSKDTPFDPPPDEQKFPSIASMALAINSNLCYPEIRSVIGEFRSSGFEEVSSPGYPHWAWKISDASSPSRKMLSVLIDDENGLICIDQHWYRVSPALIEKMIDSFVKVSGAITDRARTKSQAERVNH